MTESCIAALDVGTTAVKVCLFSRELRLLEKSTREYTLSFPEVGRAEAGEETYLTAIEAGFREVLSRGGYDVRALCMTTQGETLTAVDEAGKPLLPFLVWLDSRAAAEADELRRICTEEEFYETTGLPGIDGALPLAKLRWIRKHHPELTEKTHRYLLLEDYLLYRMTGRFVTEKSLQTSTGWFSLKTDGYWNEMLSAAGIPADRLPLLLEPGEVAGSLTDEMAERLSLPAGLPVVAGAMDQTAAALAVGCIRPGIVCETTGTALTVAACTDRPVFSEKHRVTVYRHAMRDRFIYLAIGNTGGRALTWLRDRFFPGETYDALTEKASVIRMGADGLVFLPFLSGMTDPDNRPDAKACFFGMDLATTEKHFIRSVLEGVSCELRDLLEMLEGLGCPAEQVMSLGGGASSDVWEQIKADICHTRFTVPEITEAPALGAAILASHAVGWKEEQTAPAVRRGYAPDESNRRQAQSCYERYKKVYETLLPLFD